MAELLVIRHAQAPFGSDDYDVLSDLGHRQAEAVGLALRYMGWVPDRLVTGTLRRKKDTLTGMGVSGAPEVHPGFDEYDFTDLLNARFGGAAPDAVHRDRRTHFHTLRETILEWQAGGVPGAAESWAQFAARIDAARDHAIRDGARRVLVVTSGGVIAQLVASAMGAPAAQMIELNLQVRNSAMTRFVYSASDRARGLTLAEFNATPHFADPERAALMSYH